MKSQAERHGAAPVMVHLMSSSLAELKADRSGVRGKAAEKARLLLEELGPEAWSAGLHENGAGQISLYLTPRGLDLLKGSANAIAFYPGRSWQQRSLLDNSDGALDALEGLIDRQREVEVELLLNVQGMSVRTAADGSRTVNAGAAERAQALAAAEQFFATMHAHEISNHAEVLAQLRSIGSTPSAPLLQARVTRQGLVRLADAPLIRAMRPVGHVDRRPRHFDDSAIERARKAGTADVVLVLRQPDLGSKFSAASRSAARQANRTELQDLLAAQRSAQVLTDLSEFGALHVRLSAEDLQGLRRSADQRLLAVVDNKPVAWAQLPTSGPTMNMGSAWQANIRGAGQSVIVFDTGTQANHPFLAGKVGFEACFGTSQFSNPVSYVSLCPQANAAGDSPLGLPGSAAPPFGSACATADPGSCSHGTHVAGIAAGRLAPGQTSGLLGVAPDANIVAVQVFSFDAARVQAPVAFFADLLAGLQAAYSAMVPGQPTANPYTLNMSLGGGQHAGACFQAQWTPFISAVQSLKLAGVPVVVSTGNEGFDSAIGFPACLPGTVKVSAVVNDGVGNSRAFFGFPNGANVANPLSFPGETFWVAPGGGNGTGVVSSVLGGGYQGFAGTSMAAPQMAGLYAAAKSADPSFTVDGMTDWFVANAGVPVLMRARSGASLGFNLRRVALPAL